MQANGLALKAGFFSTRQIRPLYPIAIEKRQHAAGTHAALPLQGISWPVFKKGWKKCVMTRLKSLPLYGRMATYMYGKEGQFKFNIRKKFLA